MYLSDHNCIYECLYSLFDEPRQTKCKHIGFPSSSFSPAKRSSCVIYQSLHPRRCEAQGQTPEIPSFLISLTVVDSTLIYGNVLSRVPPVLLLLPHHTIKNICMNMIISNMLEWWITRNGLPVTSIVCVCVCVSIGQIHPPNKVPRFHGAKSGLDEDSEMPRAMNCFL